MLRSTLEDWLKNRAVHIPEAKLREMQEKHGKPVKDLILAVENLTNLAESLKADKKVIANVRKAVAEVKPTVEGLEMWRKREAEIASELMKELDKAVQRLK